MNTALANTEHNVVQLTRKRSWSDDEKLAMLEEASQTSFSATARRHGVASSQLFTWRKQLRHLQPVPVEETFDVADSYRASIKILARLQALSALVVNKVHAEIVSDKLTAYNSSCALSNVVKSITAIETVKLNFLKELSQCPAPKLSVSPEESRINVEAMRIATAELRKMAQEKVKAEQRKTLLQPQSK